MTHSYKFPCGTVVMDAQRSVAWLCDYFESCTELNRKSAIKSSTLRAEGNQLFQKKLYRDALEKYTQAIVYAPHDSEELSLIYGNRSAAWFFLDKWKPCLDDIALALSPQCPQSSKTKLMLRKVQCFLKLGNIKGTESSIHEAADWIKDVVFPEEKKKDSALQELNSYEKKLDLLRQQQDIPNQHEMSSGPPCLSYGVNKVITQASSCVEIKYNLEQGRFLVGTDDIKAGDTLIVERPFAAVLLPDHDVTHCHHCYGKLTTVVPCVQCSTVRYCSFQCQELSWTMYHQVECPYLDILRSVGIAHLSLRVILTAGLQFLINFKNEYQEICSENISLVPGLDRDGQYARNYLTVFNLMTHTEDMNTSDLFQYSMTAVLLLRVLQHAQWFRQRNEEHISRAIKDGPAASSTIKYSPQMYSSGDLILDHLDHVHIQSEFSQPLMSQEKQSFHRSHYLSQSELALSGVEFSDIEVYIGGLLLRHIQQLVCNAHAITELQVSQVSEGNIAQVEETSQVRVATAIYPTASLMNHSCDPTIISSFCKDVLVVRAVKDVPKGGEIFNCYGPHHRRMGWSQRQQSLKEQYFFTCKCQPCLTDREQQSIFTAWRCCKCEDAVLETENSCQGCGLIADKQLLKKTYLEGERLFLIGLDKLKQQNITGAIEELLSCHKLWKDILYRYHQDLSKVLDCLSRCYAMQGHFKSSSGYLRESIKIVSKMYGESSIEVANELHKFSEVLISARNWTEALTVAERAIKLFSLHYGESHSTVQELFDMKKQLQECMKI
ncbi:hypothetical protein CHS0354_013846 [Potamilus streckersoni]|uniref:Protein-lysine N-methyltransferase SMYD4 n=1 Tax=Potamilus streckersoni TaxID=2493646 RepID=A0AAE0SIG0_9BIVA|nr:hypothetical protein CHS0354_013846 [Potamilus streckersoni]